MSGLSETNDDAMEVSGEDEKESTLPTTLELRLTDGGWVGVEVDEHGIMRVTEYRKLDTSDEIRHPR